MPRILVLLDVLLKRTVSVMLVSLCKLFSLLVLVRLPGCRKCSNELGMSCSCKLLLFDVFTEQINDDDDDDDDDDDVCPSLDTYRTRRPS